MSTIDDLISRIADDHLRARITEQIKVLTERKEFGLVFQDHTPEAIEVPGLAPRRNDLVRLRRDPENRPYRVVRKHGDKLTVAPVDATEHALGDPIDVDTIEVNVVKEFGEPIYAGLRSLDRIERNGNNRSHIIVQGENYYALEALMYTHVGKVDVIYIDPPYNTGSADWIYNDRYVDGQDAYRHSKWLAFMKRRLVHARALLKDTGVVIVAIGDEEHHRLRMLMDQVFGDHNFIANVTWQGSGKNDARYTAGGVDYMLIYGRHEAKLRELDIRWKEPKPGLTDALEAAKEAWSQSGFDPVAATQTYRRSLRGLREVLEPAVFRYDQIDEHGRPFQADNMTSPNYRANLVFEVLHPSTGRAVPTPKNGWRYSREAMAALLADDRVIFGADETTTPRLKRLLEDQSDRVPYPTFTQTRMPGSKHLEAILGDRRFPNPKDHEVLMRWLGAITGPDAVVLDFFGGSGTTAEAVMELNARDNGRRQSIIITNNELGATIAKKLRKDGYVPGDPEWEAEGVFQKVTWPRIHTVVTGLRKDGSSYSDGLEENVEFFELTYEDPDFIGLGLGFEAVAPLLWLKAGATGRAIETVEAEGWAINSDGSYGVLFDIRHASAFTEAANARADTLRHAFIITNQESAYQQVLVALPSQSRTFGTTRLYSDYLRTFEINGKD